MSDFTADDRRKIHDIHTAVAQFRTWAEEHQRQHKLEEKAYMAIFETHGKDLERHSKEIRKIDNRTLWVVGFVAGIMGLLTILEKLGVI